MSRPEQESTTPQQPSSSPAGPPSPPGSRWPSPANLFDAEALWQLAEEDGPAATEAETARPWCVERPAEGGWALVAEGLAELRTVCGEYQVALLLAAALPGSGRRSRFALGEQGPPFLLLDEGEPAARLPVFHADLATEESALAAVLRSPASLALLLEAAGAELLGQAARIVARRLAERAGGGQ